MTEPKIMQKSTAENIPKTLLYVYGKNVQDVHHEYGWKVPDQILETSKKKNKHYMTGEGCC